MATKQPTHTASLPEETKRALFLLEKAPFMKDYYLAGGTALALWLGHRVSVDLDFFSEAQMNDRILLEALSRQGTFRLERKEPDTVHGMLDSVKVSFFRYPYPLLEPFVKTEQVTVASIIDIACMKLDAIASRGTKRDFIDVYFVLREDFSLERLFECYQKKYARLNVNLLHVKKSLIYFEDADPEPEPRMLREMSWDEVRGYFRSEIARIGI